MVIFGKFSKKSIAARVEVSVQIFLTRGFYFTDFKAFKGQNKLNFVKIIVGVTSNNQTITLTADCAPV